MRRPTRWTLLAVGVAVTGCAVSLVAARGETQVEARNARLSFEATARRIAGSLDVALRHEEDLAVSTGATVAANPDITTRQLVDWVGAIGAQRRYPELLGVGVMMYVRHTDLEGFRARLRADPAHPLGPSGNLVVVPSGVRPFYCLLQAALTPGAVAVSAPFGVDYCAGDLAAQILSARDSGTAAKFAVPDPSGTQLVMQTPIYRGGLVPDTVDGRRAVYLGSVGTVIAPSVLFAAVLGDDADATIMLRYDGATSAAFSNRDPVVGAESVHETLGAGWSATIWEPTPATHVIALDVVALFATGGAASLLLGLLIFTLGTGRKRALRLVARRTDELQHQAVHDALTDLPNRTLILDRVEQLLTRCRRNGTVGAALYIDLDGFKDVNDTIGHEAGDQLLRAVATRLTTSLRGVDTIGRMGGDEFVVLVECGSLQVAPDHVAERLLDILREPFELERAGRPIVVTTSIGIAVGDRDAPGDLLRDADIALYRAKAAGRNCYELFRPDMETALQHQYELDYDLRSALNNDQFQLFYQPIYDLSDLTIVGAEALIRWQHPTRGLLPPDDFIPLLEASGHIIEVGLWVLHTACAQAQAWLDHGNDLTVSVNVSARQLDRDSIINHVAEALTASKLDPARLVLEITETALMIDTELTASRLQALKALGVQLAIDDFGTGYSSLAYLQRFPVDCLKIDRVFTDAATRSPETDALIHTLVQLGKNLGLRTLAEGVETTRQLDHLRSEAVDQAQGFLLARPLPAAAFESQLLLTQPDHRLPN